MNTRRRNLMATAISVAVIFVVSFSVTGDAANFSRMMRPAIGPAPPNIGRNIPSTGMSPRCGFNDISGVVDVFTTIVVALEEEKRLASKEEVEQEYFESTGDFVVEPVVYWESFSVTPQRIKPGEKIVVKGIYVAMGEIPESPFLGNFIIQRENTILLKEKIEIQEGRIEFIRELNIPESMMAGSYNISAAIHNDIAVDTIEDYFDVV